MAIKSDQPLFPGWLPTLLVLALAVAYIAADPGALATRFATHVFDLFRALHPRTNPLLVDSVPVQILFLEGIGTALLLLISARQYSWVVAVALVTAFAALTSSWLLYVHLGVLLDTANADLAIVLAALTALLAEPFSEGEPRSRATVKHRAGEARAFASGAGMTAPPLEGEVLVMTSLSCGLQRISALVRSFENDAAAFMRLADSIVTPLMEDAASHGAWISRFDGTSFSAQWPAAGNGAHADQACDAAGRMIIELGKANERLALEWPQGEKPCPTLEIGIGLATGKNLAGAVHALGRTEACLVAESGATAERLLLLSERYGAAAIASETVSGATQRSYAFLEVDFVVLDPGAPPVRLYALFGNALTQASPKFRAVATFHEHIFRSIRTRQWGKARGLIVQCRKISGADQKLYDLHLTRIAWYEANPPPPDWDGAFRAPLQ